MIKILLFLAVTSLIPWCLLLRHYLKTRQARLQAPSAPPAEIPAEEPARQGIPPGELTSLQGSEPSPLIGIPRGELWNFSSFNTTERAYTGRRARFTRDARLHSAAGNLMLVDAGVELRERSDELWEALTFTCRFDVIQEALTQGVAVLVHRQAGGTLIDDFTIHPLRGFDPQIIHDEVNLTMGQARAQMLATHSRMADTVANMRTQMLRTMARQTGGSSVAVTPAVPRPVDVKLTVKTEPAPPKLPEPKSAIDRLLEDDLIPDDGEK